MLPQPVNVKLSSSVVAVNAHQEIPTEEAGELWETTKEFLDSNKISSKKNPLTGYSFYQKHQSKFMKKQGRLFDSSA